MASTGLTLCHICENFRDADKLISPTGFKHHSTYKAFCNAAASGCCLYQLFVDCPRSHFLPQLRPDFEEVVDASKTQITWKRHSQCMFMLRQELLMEESAECLNLWLEIYTEKGEKFYSTKHYVWTLIGIRRSSSNDFPWSPNPDNIRFRRMF